MSDAERIERLERKIAALYEKFAELQNARSADSIEGRLEAIERALITNLNVDPRQP